MFKKCLTREIIKDILNKLTHEANASEKAKCSLKTKQCNKNHAHMIQAR